jgi:choline dehydrogenase-like flavoprotein
MQIVRDRHVYDVCIVGSGAGGGMAAKVLTEAGADVVMLEAGVMWDTRRDSRMFAWPYDSPRRGAPIPERQFGEFDAGLGGCTLDGEPYTTAPGERFDWFRTRMLGGRTNHWGRISLRFGPDDFRRRSLDGLGDDWPITYEDLKPYYDRVDTLVGIFGSREGLPNEPDGIFQPPPRPRCYELLIKEAADKLAIPCIASRLSILTQPLNGRPACHYCGQCGRGCSAHANFSSPSVLLPPALATKRLTMIVNAMAREVTVDDTGLASGVAYIDRTSGRENHVRARIVVLAASACESARLLLNSTSAKFPHGLANSSGVVGRYITDSTGTSVRGFIPRMMNGVPHNEDGASGSHLYMPWWLDNRRLDFPRGYHIEIGGGRRMPGFGTFGGIHLYNGAESSGRPISGGG